MDVSSLQLVPRTLRARRFYHLFQDVALNDSLVPFPALPRPQLVDDAGRLLEHAASFLSYDGTLDDPDALSRILSYAGERTYAAELADPLFASDLLAALTTALTPTSPWWSADPVLLEGRHSDSYLTDVTLFEVAPDTFMLPQVIARAYASSFGSSWSIRPLDADLLFELDTTLALWTPGSDDSFASFGYARSTALALC